jgi:hypothetical protein
MELEDSLLLWATISMAFFSVNEAIAAKLEALNSMIIQIWN